jgi:uncharacterized protein
MMDIIFGSIVAISILFWITYSIMVVIYLHILSIRYLVPIKRDTLIKSSLKKHTDLLEEYKYTDTLNVLVLSGGGVRGLVPLHILSYIENRTGKKVGELFDFVAGSSTGAITAAGICAGDEHGFKFSAKDIMDLYEANSDRIFSSPWYHQLLTCFGLFAPRFLPDNKLSVLEYYSGDTTIGELKGNLIIPVYNMDKNKLQIVKNWKTPTEKSQNNFLTKDLVNGASSPPMLFPPVAFSIKGENYLFTDPAILINNPVLHVLLHIRMIFPEKKLNIISISNGGTASHSKYNYRHMFSFGLYGLYQYLFNSPTLSSQLYIDFMEEVQQFAEEQLDFYRIKSTPDDDLSPTSLSTSNFANIRKFADKMLQENYQLINELSDQLLHHKFTIRKNNHGEHR